MTVIKKINNADGEIGKVRSLHHFGGVQTGTATIEVSMDTFLKKIYIDLPYGLAIMPLLGI